MDHTERRRRILMVAGLLAGCLMLATAAILVGGAFTGTQLTLVSLPDHDRPGPRRGEPGAIESKLARYRVPVTRPVHTTQPTADPTPTLGARKTAKATPTATPTSTRPASTRVSPSSGLSPAPSPHRGIRPTPGPVLSEAATGRTPPPRSTPQSQSPPPRKTKNPWPGKRP
ncbi:hypothetical protein [Nonomuraea sp. NEAU-A123]|uniref:hypothetical protein n=1 Tax=Nonomuraea sp. NEAU-A123 TaxID=2839649 RepID=UPI001BE4C9BF|nr:hypothetical protein [Nonomuraea sp. NEAU-A123]MBT2232572.1 hypothetical protein [Nonomuraea sp. NEAU-A123]